MTRRTIAAAFREACHAELHALKPGNVHIYANGHRMTVADFEASAEAAAPSIAARGAGVGERVLGAVRATRACTGQNTNLGIILLCAPLAAAAEMMPEAGDTRETRPRGLRTYLAGILSGLTIQDAALAFEAIALASPGGLGTDTEHDVRNPARVTLLGAMHAASARDRIAHQYATGFADIFQACGSIVREGEAPSATAERLYLHFLTRFPDSHIARKFGPETAEEIRALACDAERRLADLPDEAGRRALLLGLDATLKERGINPGTSADLTVATGFVHLLQTNFG